MLVRRNPVKHWTVLLISLAFSNLACLDEVKLQMREQTCGDRFCQHSDSGPFCQAAEDPQEGVPPEGTILCQWTGMQCVPMFCGPNPDEGGDFPVCLEGGTCESRDGDYAICVRSASRVADRMSCSEDSDCAPEPCCRPTMCVSRADEVCRSVIGCCACNMCMPCISACRCVDGCCVTEYDEDGCC